MNLKCESGSLLHIYSANYGRRKGVKVCGKTGKDCILKKSLNIVRQFCENKVSCQVAASNKVFGDPCVGTFKYLQAFYTCIACHARGCRNQCIFGKKSDKNGCRLCACKKYLKFKEKHIIGGKRIPGIKTWQKCVDLCKGLCWAIDFDRKSTSCWHHTSKTACNSFRDNINVDHYRLRNCEKNKCKTLSRSWCLKTCPRGFQKDKNGCNTCNCQRKCSPLNCKNECSFGRQVNSHGCTVCSCQKCKPLNPSSCKKKCSRGFLKDKNGCTVCHCKRRCPAITCKNKCPSGRKVNNHGCQTCACRGSKKCTPLNPSSCKKKCRTGFLKDKSGCTVCHCKRRCPAITCKNKCLSGRKLDSHGCQTCECRGSKKMLSIKL